MTSQRPGSTSASRDSGRGFDCLLTSICKDEAPVLDALLKTGRTRRVIAAWLEPCSRAALDRLSYLARLARTGLTTVVLPADVEPGEAALRVKQAVREACGRRRQRMRLAAATGDGPPVLVLAVFLAASALYSSEEADVALYAWNGDSSIEAPVAEVAPKLLNEEEPIILAAMRKLEEDGVRPSLRSLEEETGISKSKIQRMLRRLARRGLVDQDEEGGSYRLTRLGRLYS